MKPQRHWSTLFFDNPRLVILSIALIVVAGLSSFQILPRMEDPTLTARDAVVFASYPGADAERVEALLTKPVEDELLEIEEIKKLRSTSREGFATIQITLHDGVTNGDPFWTDVREALSDVRPSLPDGVSRLELREFEIAARTLIVALSWGGDGEPEPALLARLGEQLEDELRSVPGTMDAKLFGAADEEIRVEIDPARLASFGLDAETVARKVASSDAKQSAGTWRGPENELLIELQGELDSLQRIAATPLKAGESGRILHLGDIARIEKTVESPPRRAARIGGLTGVAVASRMQEGRRVDQWSAAARERVAAFAEGLPPAIELDVLFDQSGYTERRLGDLFQNLWIGAGLVMLVVLGFMGWRSALLVGTALPLSILMVFAGMRALGIPLEQMSVAGLIIALGLLIDNAIVVVDEMRRHLDEGHEPRAALRETVGMLAVPLFGSTLTTVLAFMPLVLAGGPVGEFVGSMSISVILAITSSFVVALTVIPALSAFVDSKFGRPARREPGRVLSALRSGWKRLLHGLIARPLLGLAASLVLPAFGFWAATQLPEQFFPPADRDMVHIEVELPSSTSLNETLRHTAALREHLIGEPKVDEVHWFVGESAPKFYYNQIESRENAPNFAAAIVQLTDAKDVTGWIRRVQRDLDAQLPSARVLIKLLEQGPPVEAPIELLLKGSDIDALMRAGEEVRRELAASTGVLHTTASLEGAVPQLALRLDEREVELAGLTRASVARQLEAALEGSLGGSLIEDTEELPVRVRLTGAARSDLSRLASLELPVPSDGAPRWTSLRSLGELELQPATRSITRREGVRTNIVQAWVEAGTLPAVALADLQRRLAETGFEPPRGVTLAFGGEAAERDEAVGKLAASAAILLVLMASTLVMSFRSFRLAALIGGVAFASLGLSMGSLYIFGYPFGFMAIVGTMGLVGVAINDSIVVLSAITGDERARAGDARAVAEVVLDSTRHVLATTVTTVAGFLPLFLGGGAFWPPVAVTIGGGVVGATLLALVFVPSGYALLRCRRKPQEAPEPRGEAAVSLA